MAVTRNIVFDGTIRTLKEKDGVLSDAADATALDTSDFLLKKDLEKEFSRKLIGLNLIKELTVGENRTSLQNKCMQM